MTLDNRVGIYMIAYILIETIDRFAFLLSWNIKISGDSLRNMFAELLLRPLTLFLKVYYRSRFSSSRLSFNKGEREILSRIYRMSENCCITDRDIEYPYTHLTDTIAEFYVQLEELDKKSSQTAYKAAQNPEQREAILEEHFRTVKPVFKKAGRDAVQLLDEIRSVILINAFNRELYTIGAEAAYLSTLIAKSRKQFATILSVMNIDLSTIDSETQ